MPLWGEKKEKKEKKKEEFKIFALCSSVKTS